MSAIGCAVTLALTVGPAVSMRFAARAKEDLGWIDASRWSTLLACFALPLLALIAQPKVTFLRLDGRALLVVAWLAALSFLVLARDTSARREATSRPVRGRLSMLTQLFILWSALFWFIVIWDVGMGRAVVLATQEDRLTLSFNLWETEPARDHLFLAWLSRESFDKGIAYSNHLHPILFFFYGCSKVVQLATGLPLYVGRNLSSFAMAGIGVLAFAAVVPRESAQAPHGCRFHATLFLTLGFFLSEWHFWVYPFFWGFDRIFPVVAYLAAIVWSSAQPRVCRRNSARLTTALVFFAAFGWIYTMWVIVALWCLFGRVRRTAAATLVANRPLVRASLVAAAVSLVTYGLPLLLVELRGYQNTSSSFLFRSGLDGDTQYFQNAVQAVVHPFPPTRTLFGMLFPAFVPLLLVAACSVWKGRVMRRRLGREVIFLVSLYLISLGLFPQSVSIHPYLYDMLLLLPVVLVGSTCVLAPYVQDHLRRASLLAALLLAVILIMANLIGIAQGLQRVGSS